MYYSIYSSGLIMQVLSTPSCDKVSSAFTTCSEADTVAPWDRPGPTPKYFFSSGAPAELPSRDMGLPTSVHVGSCVCHINGEN